MPARVPLRQIISTAFACCFLACGTTASAGIKTVSSVFELLNDADVIVLARPADLVKDGKSFLPNEFVVEEVLRGATGLKAKRIRVNLRDYECRAGVHYNPLHAVARSGGRIVVRHALLFLRRPKQAGKYDYEPLYSGVRFLQISDGSVLVPFQWINPGPYGFRAEKRTGWDTLLAGLREILPLKNAMFAFKNAMYAAVTGPNSGRRWVELLPSGRRAPFALRIITSSLRGRPACIW